MFLSAPCPWHCIPETPCQAAGRRHCSRTLTILTAGTRPGWPRRCVRWVRGALARSSARGRALIQAGDWNSAQSALCTGLHWSALVCKDSLSILLWKPGRFFFRQACMGARKTAGKSEAGKRAESRRLYPGTCIFLQQHRSEYLPPK